MSVCPFCSQTAHQKRNGIVAGRQRFKCLYCLRNYTEGVPPRATPPLTPRVLTKCAYCGRETPNPKFCSLSCTTSYSNTLKPRRKKSPRYCKYCGVPVTSRDRVCRKCNPNMPDRSQQTIGDIQKAAKYQISALLRHVARQTYKHAQKPYICHNCGYDKHVEICHIRAINTFPADTPVSVVSGIDNLIALCPNCHWEFDHGLLQLSSNA